MKVLKLLSFLDPQVLNAIKEGIEDVKAGRVTSSRDLKNIWPIFCNEPLKNNLSCSWSKRIDKKHRLVYQIIEQTVAVCVTAPKGHYDDK